MANFIIRGPHSCGSLKPPPYPLRALRGAYGRCGLTLANDPIGVHHPAVTQVGMGAAVKISGSDGIAPTSQFSHVAKHVIDPRHDI